MIIDLYGTTASGGAFNQGTVFELDTNGALTVLHAFTGKSDGSQPIAGVTRDSAGNLLGTTPGGGTRYFSSGTAFKLDPAGQETVLHTFQPNGADGNFPYAGLIPFGQDLYGTTSSGGTSGFGTVFKLDKAGNETVLYTFLGGTDGRYPQNSGVVHDGPGNLYGTTENGGDANDDGIVFQLDSNGAETVLHRFSGTDGSRPMAGVITDSAGNLLRNNLPRRCLRLRHRFQDHALSAAEGSSAVCDLNWRQISISLIDPNRRRAANPACQSGLTKRLGSNFSVCPSPKPKLRDRPRRPWKSH